MTETRPAAVLAGASGLVGGHLLNQLLQAREADGEPTYREVVILTRRPLGLERDGSHPGKATGASGAARPPVREIVVDFGLLLEGEEVPLRLHAALDDGHLFCALGTTIRKAGSQEAFRRVDHDYPLALGHLSRACGTTFFGLVSSIGADPRGRSFYLRVKGQVEEGLRGLGLPSLGIVRPSVIGGDRQESRPLETLGKWALSLVPGRYRTVHARDIARCMLTLARVEAPGVRVVESEEIRRVAAD